LNDRLVSDASRSDLSENPVAYRRVRPLAKEQHDRQLLAKEHLKAHAEEGMSNRVAAGRRPATNTTVEGLELKEFKRSDRRAEHCGAGKGAPHSAEHYEEHEE
jgi:hypothetical protein